MDREMLLDTDSASVLLRRAIQVDASFLPAHIARVELSHYGERRNSPGLRESYPRVGATRADPVAQCLAVVANAPTGYPLAALDTLLALDARAPTPCSEFYLSLLTTGVVPERAWATRVLAVSRRAMRSMPELADPWLRAAAVLLQLGRAPEAEQTCADALAHAALASDQLRLQECRAGALRAMGDSARANAVHLAVEIAVERDGRPLLRLMLPAPSIAFRALSLQLSVTAGEMLRREHVQVASGARSPRAEWSTERELGVWLTDAGRPKEALKHLNRATLIADSLDAPLMQLDAYRFRGRAYAKLGQWPEAERDLKHAIADGASTGDAYFLAEAWHNLAHVYEGSARLREAAQAVDRFIALTRPLVYAQPRMMSLHDAGVIRWKAGWPAASNAAFADMVQVVDEQERNYFWAAQYFERVGDYARAQRYYQRGLERDRDDRSLNLGGLARVFLALGQVDSAEAAAQMHDAAMSNERDVPLLPAILAEHGRKAEAESIVRSWVRARAGDGNLQAQAVTTAALADMLLSWGNAGAASTEAFAAEGLARRVNLTETVIQALRIRGSAQLKLGANGEALTTLQEATTLIRMHYTLDNAILSYNALGDALAASGKVNEALNAFDQSARYVEGATAALDRDMDRVRYRERQLAPFDGALRTLAASREKHGSIEALVDWSRRRKAAALMLATGVKPLHAATSTRLPPSIASMQRTLAPESAIIDFLFPDSMLMALVITRGASHIVRLPAREDSVRKLATQMTAPFNRVYANRIDLARATFAAGAARALYALLLAPVEPYLHGATRLLVVPDGPLNAVSFDALMPVDSERPQHSLPRDSQPHYAIDRYEITLAPTLDWHMTSKRSVKSPQSMRVLAVAREAPGVDRETDAILAAWPRSQVKLLRNAAATESAIDALGDTFDVVHFATHATADDRDPLASHLQLSPDSVSDGFLHLSEISARRRTARVVVLSACQTLSGPLYDGEGLMGLARAFLMSGAKEVVATSWPSGAVSADLMEVFHRELASGASTGGALRDAKLSLRRNATTAHPFFWAGFVVVTSSAGEWIAAQPPKKGAKR